MIGACLVTACMYVALSYSSSTWNDLQWQKIAFQVVFCFVLEVTTCIGGACIFIIAGSTPIWFFFLSLPRLARCLLKNPFPLGPFLKIGLCHFHPLKFDLSKIDFCTFFYFPFYWIILIIFFTISSSVSFFLSNFITILFIANFFPFISFLNCYFFHDFIIQS